MSKVEQVKAVIAGKHCMGSDSLTDYHAARKAVNACHCLDPYAKLATVKRALKNYNVVATLGPVGDVMIRDFSTGQSCVI